MSQSVAIRSSELKTRPSDDVVEEMYDRVMAALLLPENVVKQMKATETIEAKWQKVLMNNKMVEMSASSTKLSDDDIAQMDELRRTAWRPSVKKLAALRDKLKTGSRGLIDGFYRRDGLDLLATILWAMSDGIGESYTELEAACTILTYQCIKTLANHRSGLEQIANHIDLFSAISQTALRDIHSATGGAVAVLGFELLAVATHFGYAHAVTTKALQINDDQNKDPMVLLRKAFLAGKHQNNKFEGRVNKAVAAAVLTLANELINAQTDRTQRAQLRSFVKPFFEEIRLDDANNISSKQNIARHSTDMDGSLLATKQNVTGMARAFGVNKIKRRDFWLRDGRLWWQSGGDDATLAENATNNCSQSTRTKNGPRRGSLWGNKSISPQQKQEYPSDDSESHGSSSLNPSCALTQARYIDLTSVDSINGSSYEKDIREETPFAFELVLTNGKTIAYGTLSQVERRAWLEALRRAKDRIDLTNELAELDETTGSALRRGSTTKADEIFDDEKAWKLIWQFFFKSISTAEHRADDVIKAQRIAYERMTESDRIEALAENDGLDLTDLRSVTQQLQAAAAADPGTEAKLIELLGGTLKRLRAGAPLESEMQSSPVEQPPEKNVQSPKKVRLPPPLPTSPPPQVPNAESTTTTNHSTEEDPRVAKFKKMAKLQIPLEAIKLKMKAEGVDPTLLDESKKVTLRPTSQVKPSSTPAPSGPLAKYQKMLKMHIPLQAIQNKMRAEGLDPNQLQTNELSQTNSAVDTGLPMAMPTRSRASSRLSARRPGSVRSVRIFGEPPRVPMRPWFWTPLRGEKETTTGVWAKAQSTLVQVQTKLDTKTLENAFAKVQTSTTITTTKSKSIPSAINIRRFVDPRIEQNVGIVLAKLRIPVRELAAAVARGDVNIVTAANAELLKHAIPSDEDAAAAMERDDLDLKPDDGTATDASLVEIWFRSCASVPRYRDRVDALRLRHGLDQLALELESALNSVSTAADAVVDHSDLSLALAACLATGNYLNGASVRGDAKAFNLSGLGRLSTTKGADGSTLAQHVATLLTKSDPQAIDRLHLLKTTILDPAAAANCPGTWDNELSELDLRLTRLERLIQDDERAISAGAEMAASAVINEKGKNRRPLAVKAHLDAIAESDDDDTEDTMDKEAGFEDEDDEDEYTERQAFVKSVKPFAAVARLRIDEIKNLRAGLDAKLQVCADSFGEASASPKELFEEYLGCFIRALKSGQQANIRREQEEDAKRKREARRGSSTGQRSTDLGRSSEGDLFESFQRSQLGDLARRRATLNPTSSNSFDD
mmetsp:Transcript_10260/g.15534  ORF Transcript_10260/g.15534 Transcript_10260/m.15534 type:complete len:1295 (+) Transcript_10260:98-3982(+)